MYLKSFYLLICFFPLFLQAQFSPPIGPGNTYQFNGATSFNIGNQVADNLRTIELWFKSDIAIGTNLGSPISLIVRDFNNGSAVSQHEFGLYFTPSSWGGGGKISFLRRVFSTRYVIQSDQSQWQAGIWYHVAAVIDPNGGMRMYINGVLQQETNNSTDPVLGQTGASTDDVSIARWGNTSSAIRMFRGEMDEVRLWTTARSQTDIRSFMCQKLAGNETGLRAYYRFDATTGSTLDDLTTNNFDGSLVGTNTPSWRISSAPVGDLSTYLYLPGPPWPTNNPVLQLAGPNNDNFGIWTVPNPGPDGIHIYRVDSKPNFDNGLPPCYEDFYFGVFMAHDNGTNFPYEINYAPFVLSSGTPVDVYKRADNAANSWSGLNTNLSGGNLLKNNQNYRGEYILTYDTPPLDLGPDTLICQGGGLLLSAQNGLGNASYRWQDNSSNQQLQVTQSGLYWVERTDSCGTQRDSILVTVEPMPMVNLGPDSTLCAGDSIQLQVTTPNLNYQWQDNSTASSFIVRNSGLYWVRASNLCGTAIDSIQITFATPPPLDLGPDTLLCDGDQLLLQAGSPAARSFSWQDNSSNSSFLVSMPGLYWVTVENRGCRVRDSIRVSYLAYPQVNLGPDTTLCDGDSLQLSATSPLGSLLWQDASTDPTFTVTQAGLYWVVASNLCGTAQDSVEISYTSYPQLDLGPDTVLCAGDQFTVSAAAANAGAYTWQNSSTAANFNISSAGIYWVDADNQGCISRDSIQVFLLPAPTADLGVDTALCVLDTLPIRAYSKLGSFVWHDGSTDSVFQVTQAGTFWVTATNACGVASDSIDIVFFPTLPIDLGADTVLCSGDSLLLRASWPGATYRWQDGSTADTLWATKSATYIVRVDRGCAKIDSIAVNFAEDPDVDLGPDQFLCEGDTILLDAFAFVSTYLWSTGDTTSNISATTSGLYWAEVNNVCGTDRDSVQLEFAPPPPQPMLGRDSVLCPGEFLQWDLTSPGVTYLWSDGSTGPAFVATDAGLYWVELSTACRSLRDSIFLEYDSEPTVNLPPDSTLCEGDEFILQTDMQQLIPVRFQWQDGSIEPYYLVMDSGWYTVQVENRCGSDRDSMYVAYSRVPEPILPPDTVLCPGELLQVNGSTPFADRYIWSHPAEDTLLWVDKPAKYVLWASNSCGIGQDTMVVEYGTCDCTVFFANAFTPNDDSHNDRFGPIYECEFDAARFMIFNRWGQKVFESSDPTQWWDGRFKNQSVPEGVYTWVFIYTGRKNRLPFDARLKGTVTVIR